MQSTNRQYSCIIVKYLFVLHDSHEPSYLLSKYEISLLRRNNSRIFFLNLFLIKIYFKTT